MVSGHAGRASRGADVDAKELAGRAVGGSCMLVLCPMLQEGPGDPVASGARLVLTAGRWLSTSLGSCSANWDCRGRKKPDESAEEAGYGTGRKEGGCWKEMLDG